MNENYDDRPRLMDRIRPNLFWIIFVFGAWYMVLNSFPRIAWESVLERYMTNISPAMYFTLDMYAATLIDIITLCILCNIFRKNRYIWKSFMLSGSRKKFLAGDVVSEDDAYAELYGRSRNSLKMLFTGLLLGFLTNFFCILCALLHGDIKLYFECSLNQIPYFLFSLLCVCIQSSAEELWCRGFLYERLHERYPLWLAVAVNGVLFGLLHIFNPGASAIPIIGIVICGISYSLLRWYSGNIWIAMGIHTGWNFTQNYLFGLPNSGLVSEASIFHLDAATGSSSLIYDYLFGVEGGLPSLFTDSMIAVVIIILAVRNGRIRELGMSRIPALEAMGLRMHIDESDDESVSEETPDADAVQEAETSSVPAASRTADKANVSDAGLSGQSERTHNSVQDDTSAQNSTIYYDDYEDLTDTVNQYADIESGDQNA